MPDALIADTPEYRTYYGDKYDLPQERFFLVPEWRDDPAPEGRVRLIMHPGIACGTGTHAATRLCLTAMERHVAAGDSVLDVGTGSGILADAARVLGASPVFEEESQNFTVRVVESAHTRGLSTTEK